MSRRLNELDRNFNSTHTSDGLQWYDIQQFPRDGQGWQDVEHWADRLPVRAREIVGPITWQLSQHSAGLSVRFATDSPKIATEWTVRFDELALPHMPANGVSGLDLYVRENGTWRWMRNGGHVSQRTTRNVIFDGSPGLRQYLLYFPLYNGIQSLSIGIEESATLSAGAPWRHADKSIVFFGTSIVQGGCASRSGLSYPAFLGRWLDCPVYNVGFSGNGPMRLDMVPYLGELDPTVFVIDSLPNMQADHVAKNAKPFITGLRKLRPHTPLVIVENITYQITLEGAVAPPHAEKNAQLRKAYEELVADGVTGLHYLPGDDLLGHDWEATVDGTHPNDIGFQRMAKAMEPLLRQLTGIAG